MKNPLYLYGTLLFILFFSACSNGLPPHIAAQFATPSPTPFLPISTQLSTSADELVEASLVETNVNISEFEKLSKEEINDPWLPFAGPSLFSDIAIPAPFPKIEIPEEQFNILILGSDQRPGDTGFRTDVLMLLTLNAESGIANLVSFPRDLYVYQPGYKMDRINSAQSRGGIELSYLTFEYNFGIQIDHHILINFSGFERVIDSLGGIQVNVGQILSDHRDGFGTYTVNSGNVVMDAETALWYVRSRGTSNDFERTHRQQEIISALFFEAFSLDIFRNASDIYAAYKDTIQSDMGFGDLLQFLPLASQIKTGGNIGMYFIGPNEVIPWVTSSKAQVLLPDRENVQAVLFEALLGQ